MPGRESSLLVADIGGTNIRFALARWRGGALVLEKKERYFTAGLDDLAGAMERYFTDVGFDSRGQVAVFAVCAPVTSDEIVISKLSWRFSLIELQKRFGFKSLQFCNDLEALMYSVDHLAPAMKEALLLRPVRGNGVRAVLSAGTGLGMAFEVSGPEGKKVCPSEGGLTRFSPGDEREFRLFEYCFQKGNVRLDDLISGPGLVMIYDFLREDSSLNLKKEDLPVRSPEEITRLGQGEEDGGLCREACELFLQLYSRVAARVALTFLPLGGLYIAGNIASQFEKEAWVRALARFFEPQEREIQVLREIPVFLVTDVDAPLLGAAVTGLR